MVHWLSKKTFDPQIYKHNMFRKCIHISYTFCSSLVHLTSKCINKGSPGLTNPEVMEMLGFGPSHNKTEILLNQN